MIIADLLGRIGFHVEHEKLDEASEALEGIKRRLEFLAAAEVIKGIFELTERFSGFAENLSSAAEAAGLTTEQLQRLQFAAGQSGVSAEDMGTGLGVLSRKLYEARKGSEEAVKSFAAVGIGPEQIASFRTTSEALAAVADHMSSVEDPIARQAITMDLFGRGSSKMVKFLSEGSKAMAENGKAAQDMGAVVSGPAVVALNEVEDALSGFWQTVKAFSATVAAMFAPSIRSAVKDFQAFYAANRAILMVNLEHWVAQIVYAFGYMVGVTEVVTSKVLTFAAAHPVLVRRIGEVLLILGGLSLAVSALMPILSGVSRLVEGLSGGMGSLGSVFKYVMLAGGLLQKGLAALFLRLAVLTETLLPALSEAFLGLSAAISATPVGWLLAGLAAIVLAVNAIYTVFFKQGGSWKDTWIYQIFDKIIGSVKWLKGKLGFGDAALPGAEAQPGDQAAGQQQKAETPDTASQSLLDRLLNRTPQTTAPDIPAMLRRLEDVRSAAAAPVATLLPVPGAAGTPPPSGGPQNTTINAPITVNIPSGTPPMDVAAKAKEAVVEHLARMNSEALRASRVAQAY